MKLIFQILKIITFLISITKEILYDISVCIFSSMILVWGIDEINYKIQKKEEEKKHFVIYNKIIPIVNEYYEFYLKLYISTRKDEVKENEKVLKSLIACKTEFIKQLEDTEPFYKDGFYADSNKVKLQMAAMFNNTANAGNDPLESTSIPYYKCWCNDSIIFYDGIEQIEKIFPDFFPNDLIIKIEKLLDLVKPVKNLADFIELKQMKEFDCFMPNMQIPDKIEFPVDFFLKDMKLIEILTNLEDVIQYIDNETGKFLRQRDTAFFNDRNVKPILGDAYKKNLQ